MTRRTTARLPPAPRPPVPCRYWIAAQRTYCGALPTRPYVPGHRCDEHSPAAVAAAVRPESPTKGKGI